jgi:hypothetical protein
MICVDTIEDKIIQLQEKKRALAKDLIADDNTFVNLFREKMLNTSLASHSYLFSPFSFYFKAPNWFFPPITSKFVDSSTVMKKLILLLCILSSAFITQAQVNGSVKGKLLDTAGKQPLSEATVSVMLVKDSSLVSFLYLIKRNFEITNLDAAIIY